MSNLINETMQIWLRTDPEQPQGFRPMLVNPDHHWMMYDEDIKVGEVEVSYDLPDEMDPEVLALKAIQTLKDKQDAIMAKAREESKALDHKIQNLMRITHQPESDVVEGELVE